MYFVMAACGAAFYLTLTLPSMADMERTITAYSVIPAQFTGHAAVTPAALPVRPVPSLFLPGGWLHLAGNMLFPGILGDNGEGAGGSKWCRRVQGNNLGRPRGCMAPGGERLVTGRTGSAAGATAAWPVNCAGITLYAVIVRSMSAIEGSVRVK